MTEKAKDMTEKAKVPTWGYRLKDGEVEAQLFPDGLPKGWKDTPAKLKEAK